MRLLEQTRVGGEQLIEKLAHPLCGLDVGVCLGDVLRLLHACPGQEEREVLVDVPDRDHQVLAGLRVDGKQFGVVGDDHEAGAVPHHRGRGPQLVDHRERVAGRLLEVDDVLLRDLGRLVIGDVERAIAQARDVALRLPVRQEQLEDELAVVRLAPPQRCDTLLNSLQVESHHIIMSFRARSTRAVGAGPLGELLGQRSIRSPARSSQPAGVTTTTSSDGQSGHCGGQSRPGQWS